MVPVAEPGYSARNAAIGSARAARIIGIYGVLAYLVTLRRHEFGVRVALGAQPGSLLRLVLFGFLSATLAAVMAGLLPAVRAARLDPNQVLKAAGPKSSAGPGEQRLLRSVTIAQTALTLALLVRAGLLIRTMMNLANVQSGFDTRYILTMSVTAVQGQWDDFHHRVLERVSAIPTVEQAAFAWGVPLTGNNWPGAIEIEGQPAAARESDRIAIPLRSVTEGYFRLLHSPLID